MPNRLGSTGARKHAEMTCWCRTRERADCLSSSFGWWRLGFLVRSMGLVTRLIIREVMILRLQDHWNKCCRQSNKDREPCPHACVKRLISEASNGVAEMRPDSGAVNSQATCCYLNLNEPASQHGSLFNCYDVSCSYEPCRLPSLATILNACFVRVTWSILALQPNTFLARINTP